MPQEPEDQDYFSQFVTLPEVRRAIHVGNLTFHDGSEVEKHLLQDVMKTIKPWLGVLMDNYRVKSAGSSNFFFFIFFLNLKCTRGKCEGGEKNQDFAHDVLYLECETNVLLLSLYLLTSELGIVLKY